MNEIKEQLRQGGYAPFPAEVYRARLQARGALGHLPVLLESFAKLSADQFMGDGGTYRNRAYSRFLYRWDEAAPKLVPLEGHSIYQTLEDNPVNGGILRTYAPLAPDVENSPLLRHLILVDAELAVACDPTLARGDVQVGVHQVRIVARSGAAGLPTPEGVHRDSERFTFQHFCQRINIEGGEFRAYDSERRLLFGWLQQECLDTVMFAGSTWHSATPVSCVDADQEGYRDILLIDFDPLKA